MGNKLIARNKYDAERDNNQHRNNFRSNTFPKVLTKVYIKKILGASKFNFFQCFK